MTVLVIGKDPTAVKQVTCSNCGSILQYTPDDTRIARYVLCGHTESERVIDCPSCNNTVIV